MGAMENAGAVTLRDEYLPRSRQDAAFYEFRCSVILHEMAHMWFGDLVTMKWWDDLWLNESFAEWACYHAAVENTEFTESWTGFTNARKNWALRQDQLPSRPTRSPPTTTTCTRSRSTSTASPTPRAPRCSSSSSPGSASSPSSSGLRAYFKDHAYAQLRVRRPAHRAREGVGPRARRLGQGVAADQRREHPRPRVRARRRRHLRVVRASARPRPATTRRCAGTASASACTTRWAAAWSVVRNVEIDVEGDLTDDRRAGRRAAARPAAAQRRRPHLRQDPARRALAGHRRRRPRACSTTRWPGRCAGARRGT